MSPALARLLVRLHAPAWRRRYGEEFETLLIETPLTAANVLNAGESAMDSRRLGMVIPLVALASLAVAALVSLPAHRSASGNLIQVAAAKGAAPCHSKRARDDKVHCA
jgi:hypothetical protein